MSFSDHENFRRELVDNFKREIFGPVEIDEQNEELSVSPFQKYGVGVLFPQKCSVDIENSDSDSDGDEKDDLLLESSEDQISIDAKSSSLIKDDVPEGQALNLANEYNPSALGITFKMNNSKGLLIEVSAGKYEAFDVEIPNPKAGTLRLDGSEQPTVFKNKKYKRNAISHVLKLEFPESISFVQDIQVPDTSGMLTLHCKSRDGKDGRIVSLMLVNNYTTDGSKAPLVEESFFQAGFKVRDIEEQSVFLRVDRAEGNISQDELASMDLLYRHRQSFCLGHGCAGDWHKDKDVESNGITNLVFTSSLPEYELKPIVPREKAYGSKEINLSMEFLSCPDFETEGAVENVISSLEALCNDYLQWIQDQRQQSPNLNENLAVAAERHLSNCENCYRRMLEGVKLLQEDDQAMLAFRLANRAMMMQQYHSNLPSRSFGSPMPNMPEDYKNLPGGERKWRPFQLAFVLMTISGSTKPDHLDKDVVDLIWFPTGGGKTEAYLGLAAYVTCLRRLRKRDDLGTSIIMRYTLRLLTAQQFQRASALILALDSIRQDHVFGVDLGAPPISIGLWVGKSLTPNKRQDAVGALRNMRGHSNYGRKPENPFQVLHCPWCKVEMDDSNKYGYVNKLDNGVASVGFRCPDSSCRWGETNSYLPIVVIDDDIYEDPPTMVIGTVDKFAQLAWDDRTANLFGVGDASPPDLIIQDELHLISGPLGTIVGLYEGVIDRLCTRDNHRPKVVASTATIRRAGEQCRALYNRSSFEFPPQGLSSGDSYFAFEDGELPGRLYLGVFASALKSHATAQVYACSALLQFVLSNSGDSVEENLKFSDPYGTLVWYFNSLRELGHANTMVTGDISERLKGICHRNEIPFESRRRIRSIVELTSRRTADEIPSILSSLDTKWTPKVEDKTPVDVLLATNMIAVGVDVSRLGLMVVTGQPKNTAEYIQATSRVGRQYPGLVVTMYNQSKSRDRSHYEQFVAYHQSLYRFVEPTSVTPFSPPARDRGMRGVLIATARLISKVSTPAEIIEKRSELLKEIELLINRVESIDPGEAQDAKIELENWLGEWKEYLPPFYGPMAGAVNDQTLAYPFGSHPDPIFQSNSWPVMTSMRNVDGVCEAKVVTVYRANNNSDGGE